MAAAAVKAAAEAEELAKTCSENNGSKVNGSEKVVDKNVVKSLIQDVTEVDELD